MQLWQAISVLHEGANLVPKVKKLRKLSDDLCINNRQECPSYNRKPSFKTKPGNGLGDKYDHRQVTALRTDD